MMRLEAHWISDTGRRSTRNEDYACIDVAAGVFVVADGLGGRPAGDLASRTAVNSFVTRIRQLGPGACMDRQAVGEVIRAVNVDVQRLAEGRPEWSGAGTTLSAALLGLPVGRIVHVGDSRVYLFRHGTLTRLTSDHTLVAELIRLNRLSAETARQFPLQHVLSRSIGTCETVEPEVEELTIQGNDWLLLMTDGLHNVLSDATVEHLISASQDQTPEQMCLRLVRAALAHGADDDLTIIAIHVRE